MKTAAAAAEFQRRVAALGGEVLESAWLGAAVPHLCRCTNGHECRPRPTHVQQGRGICRICAGLDPVTIQEGFYRRVAEQGGTVLELEWLGSSKPHLCRCARGHECRPRPKAVQQGHGICLACAGRDSALAWRNFRDRVAELGGVVLEPAWLGKDNPHRCQCAEGHECHPRPGGVQQGEGICLACSGKDPATAWAAFRKRIAELGGVVLEPAGLGGHVPHHCRCARGHDCWPMPSNVLRGRGICRVCSWRGQDVLYLVRNPAAHCIKFGITSHGGHSRLADHTRAGFTETVRLEPGLPEYFAAHIEQKIKAALKLARTEPVRGLEYFGEDHTAMILSEIDSWMASTKESQETRS